MARRAHFQTVRAGARVGPAMETDDSKRALEEELERIDAERGWDYVGRPPTRRGLWTAAWD